MLVTPSLLSAAKAVYSVSLIRAASAFFSLVNCLIQCKLLPVKQISEEAVTRKFVHEESSSITSLCGAVEACLLHGLKKRALGLFKHGTTTALLQKLSKHYEPAGQVLKIVNEIETNNDPTRFSKLFQHGVIQHKHNNSRPPTIYEEDTNLNRVEYPTSSTESTKSPSKGTSYSMLVLQRVFEAFPYLKSLDSGKAQPKKTLPSYSPKYLWLRIAIFEKQLAKILDYLVQNNSKYYEADALIADPVDGPILASLLVGPCALDYTKMKTTDHFWTDPPADELVQRHRIHSGATHHLAGPGSPKRPGLQQVRRHTSSSSEESMKGQHISAKEYVESLHQNSKNTLLYGKNNVLVQPKEDVEALPGYLSLHQSAEGLTIKWTPNQLMNGCYEDKEDDFDRRSIYKRYYQPPEVSNILYWDYALTIYVDEIVYIHCHQQPDCGGTIVLVGQDGVQRPPIHFPKGGHLLAFLSCLENGLLPHGQLDPPLWSQRGKGKVFPKMRRKGNKIPTKEGSTSSSSTDEEEATDYVFRIVATFKPDNIPPEMLDPKLNVKMDNFPWPFQNVDPIPPSQSTMQSYARAQEEQNNSCLSRVAANHRATIKQLCDTMKNQIISRAFYGWLAHCRHLKTVRTHLSGLVHHSIVSPTHPCNANLGLTPEKWQEICQDGKIANPDELYRLVYYGGVTHEIRKEVWPYLLDSSHPETLPEESSTAGTTPTAERKWSSREIYNYAPKADHDTQTEVDNAEHCDSEGNDVPDSSPDDGLGDSIARPGSLPDRSKLDSAGDSESTDASKLTHDGSLDRDRGIIVTKTSIDSAGVDDDLSGGESGEAQRLSQSQDLNEVPEDEEPNDKKNDNMTNSTGSENARHLSASKESLISPASPASNGGIYSPELLDNVALNLHRIDKDVQRCDRNYWYFTPANLDKLRNIMCTYVWEHLDIGYVQGMCDLVAPLLVIFDDEALTYSCFCELMKRMAYNFPHGGAMDNHFANMRSLIQILDSELFEHMHQNGDYTHFYFCYRWFLLDFKRELVYDDVFCVWETIWAAKHISSAHFVLFIALALVEYYRDIILDNNMDFTDIIKFFNEMAERHNAKQVLKISRELVLRIQTLIENK
ncbi:Small G protein signaling modulator 2,Small G protein signaling modulator 1 [Acanthosepion pharaonis]|uniref:Small G protein signaling modulator 2,Small G protein signaling modulator 1 n=1 Tax=Acanthosepion pharaonis TaxID=158019 RepID=A0A812CME9_ACAPH|nr:Small G protein signaling modulator 2,Small G protein signaling modulator 1 [Sepia pharaonis]